MASIYIDKSIFILSIIIIYAAAIRFNGSRYFYYVFAIAAAGPVSFILQNTFFIHTTFQNAILPILMLIGIPKKEFKIKYLSIVLLFIALLEFELREPLVLIINESILAIILLNLIEDFYNKFVDSGVCRIYLVLFILDVIITGVNLFMQIEQLHLAIIFRFWLIVSKLFIWILIAAFGPETGIKLKWLQKFIDRIHFQIKTTDKNYQTVNHNGIESKEFIIDAAKLNHGLTHSEIRIMDYIARGKTNIEIADSCHISKRTVEAHLQHIKDKLGLENMREVREFVRGLRVN